MANKLLTAVVAMTVAGALLGPLGAAVTSSTGTVDVTDETVTATGEFQDLQGYDIDEGSVSVTDSTGTTVDPGNYSVRYESGVISVDNGTSAVVDDGEQVDVSYSYQATDGSSTVVAGLVPLMAALLILATLAKLITGMM